MRVNPPGVAGLDVSNVPPYLLAQETPVGRGALWLAPGLDCSLLSSGATLPGSPSVICIPWFLSRAMTLIQMSVNAVATVASATINNMALYSTDASLFPKRLVCYTGNQSWRNVGQRAFNLKQGQTGVVGNIPLLPGLYWAAAFNYGTVTPNISYLSSSSMAPLFGLGSFGAAPVGLVGWNCTLSLAQDPPPDPFHVNVIDFLKSTDPLPLIFGRFLS